MVTKEARAAASQGSLSNTHPVTPKRERTTAFLTPTSSVSAVPRACLPDASTTMPPPRSALPPVKACVSVPQASPPPPPPHKARMDAPPDNNNRYEMTGDKAITPTEAGDRTRYWRCSGKLECGGRCTIRVKRTYFDADVTRTPAQYKWYLDEQSWPSTPPLSAHGHGPAKSLPLSNAATELLNLTLTQSLESTPNKVWTRILVDKRLAGEDVTDRTNTPSLQQVRDRMRGARAREFESVDFVDRLREIGVQFRLRMDHVSNDRSRFLLMLFTDYTRDLLARFGNTLTLLDGTFSLVESDLVTHILAVEHAESGQLLPCVFVCLDRQDEAAYVAMFE